MSSSDSPGSMKSIDFQTMGKQPAGFGHTSQLMVADSEPSAIATQKRKRPKQPPSGQISVVVPDPPEAGDQPSASQQSWETPQGSCLQRRHRRQSRIMGARWKRKWPGANSVIQSPEPRSPIGVPDIADLVDAYGSDDCSLPAAQGGPSAIAGIEANVRSMILRTSRRNGTRRG